MKGLKLGLLFVAAALMIMGVTGTSYAFHEGGVAYCEGCHTMHESINDAVVAPQTNPAAQFANYSNYLLKGSDQSSTCLNCHRAADTAPSGYHIMTGTVLDTKSGIPVEKTPGGDFAWLLINGSGQTTTAGKHKAHNIVAMDFSLTSSTNYGTGAPGGGATPYPVGALHCNSCHDPHPAARYAADYSVAYRTPALSGNPITESGSYNNSGAATATEATGVYRFLGGVGYLPKSAVASGFTGFTADPPFAVAPSTYNQVESTQQVRVAYGSGMSEWCANCHGQLLNSGAINPTPGIDVTHIHPAGNNAKLTLGGEGALYNAYVKSGDMSGSSATSFLSLVPFEMGLAKSAANYATLQGTASNVNSAASLVGPDANANVMCLSCHRAHASGFPFMLRFNATNGQFITGLDNKWVGTDSTDADGSSSRITLGYSQNQMQNAYYGRMASDFAPTQRVLCNKCHAKD
jgi:hypothetical protein